MSIGRYRGGLFAAGDALRLLVTSGNVIEALRCSEVTLVANEKALGQSHAWTKESAQLKADALVALGRAEEAEAPRACYKI